MKNNSTLLAVLLVAGLVVAMRQPSANHDQPTTAPRRDVLVSIVDAFAFNLEEDGRRDSPRVTHTAQVGFLFDEFGRRSTLGKSYRDTFRKEFKQLGLELSAAMGLDDELASLPLTSDRRAAAVATLRDFSDRLNHGAL